MAQIAICPKKDKKTKKCPKPQIPLEPALTGNILWLDAVYGDDETAQPFNGNLPYASLKKALRAVQKIGSSSVLQVFIRPGDYYEGTVQMIDLVSIRGSGRLSTQVYGTLDTSQVIGTSSTALEFTVNGVEQPALLGTGSGVVSFRMMRLASNYVTNPDNQAAVVIAPGPIPRHICLPSPHKHRCIRITSEINTGAPSHVITDSEIALTTNGGADIKLLDHVGGDLQLERNQHTLTNTTLPQINVTTTPFTARQNNVQYVLQQATEITLGSRNANPSPLPPAIVPDLSNVQIVQAVGGPSKITSALQINGITTISIGQTLAISNRFERNGIFVGGPYVYISQLVSANSPAIPSNIRIYALGGKVRPFGQTFRGLNNRSQIASNSQIFESSNLKVVNTPQTALPIIIVTTVTYTAMSDNTQYNVTATSANGPITIILPTTPIQGGGYSPTLTNISILSQTNTPIVLVSQADILNNGPITNGQLAVVSGSISQGGGGFTGYVISYFNSTLNNISAKQVGESHALTIPGSTIVNSDVLLNTPGISNYQLQEPARGNLSFRIGPATNNTFVAVSISVPNGAVTSKVVAVQGTQFGSPLPGAFKLISPTQGVFTQPGLYTIDNALSIGFWTVRYQTYPNALIRVLDLAPELPAKISINTPTIEDGDNIDTLITSEATTSTIHVNQTAAFNTRRIPSINYPEVAQSLTSVQQVSTQYEHLRGGTRIEATSNQLTVGQSLNITTPNLQTVILAGNNTVSLPPIVPYKTPATTNQVLSGTRYLLLQGQAVTSPSTITASNQIIIAGSSSGNTTLIVESNQVIGLTAVYPTSPTFGTPAYWLVVYLQVNPNIPV